MMFRTVLCCAALVLALSPNASAASACDGTACGKPAPAKPLDIMQFMREQAASTRVSRPRPANTGASTRIQRPAQRKVTARPKPAPLLTDAAKSSASQPEQTVELVASDELNAIDRAANPSPPETVGAAVTSGPGVQMVDVEEFNHIDRKADDGAPLSMPAARSGDAPTHNEQANPSWLQWIWSALANTLTALASAVHHLIG